MQWTELYRPKNLNELVGQEQAKQKMLYFLRQKTKRVALLFGPSGSGKTSLACTLASDLKLELIELNASDFRNKQKVHDIIGSALKQRSLFTRGKLILVDELEGIDGTKDRGGLQELMRLIKEAAWPMILVANNVSDKKLRPLKRLALPVELKKFDDFALSVLLKKLCEKENLNIADDALGALVVKAQGDARAAINDLQVLASLKEKITKKDVACLQSREKEETISDALNRVFKTKNALNAFDYVDMNIDEIFLWLDENLPYEYDDKELAAAYEMLSKADVLKGRIHKQQHWRFLSHIMALITEGIASVKKDARQGISSYKQPSRILKIWMAKQKLMQKRAVAGKLSKATHCSKKKAYKELGYLKIAFQKQPENIADELNLEPEELDFLR
jgi:replication factor C large subunit